MTPEQFVGEYHLLPVEDRRLDLNVTLKLKRYTAGWPQQDLANGLLHTIAERYCKLKRGLRDLTDAFYIQYHPKIDPTEVFYKWSIRRAFGCRGSPDEIRDALRLAVAADDKLRPRAQVKGEEWFGQDCNSFVGNYYGVSPMIGVSGYAKGFKVREFGDTPDLGDCVELFGSGLPTRERLQDIDDGDILVTYGPLQVDSKTNKATQRGRWRHIALVQSATVAEMPIRVEGATGFYLTWISIVEWGGAVAAKHTTGLRIVEVIDDVSRWDPRKSADWRIKNNPEWKRLVDGLALELKTQASGKKVTGFLGDFDGAPAIRFFLDASRLRYIGRRGWHIRGWHLGH